MVAGFPVQDVRVRLFDGQHHSVDSSEMAFKIAGSMAFKDAMENAQAVLMEPIMTVTVAVPEEYVGDVIGDLNSRRGRPLGMEPKGGVTEVKAEVPMAEMLSYAPDLRAITGGQGEYSMELARYEEMPAHIAQCVVQEMRARRRGGQGVGAYHRGDEEGAQAGPRRRHLRRLRAHHPQGRAHRGLPGPGRAPPPGLRPVRAARPARRLDPRVGGRRHAQRMPRSEPRRGVFGPAAPAAPGAAGPGRDGGEGGELRPPARRGRAAGARGIAPRRAAAPAALAPQGPAPRARRADHRRGEDRARARPLQRLRPPAHDRRASPARSARRS